LNLFGKNSQQKREETEQVEIEPLISDGRPEYYNVSMPDTLDLGWYYNESKNQLQMAKIAQKDRATHLYVIGATGTGKTKFLEFLISQDIQQGIGFGVIDPHGDLIEDIKGILACRYRNDGDEQEISERYLGNIMIALLSAGLVQSTRGSRGGFSLAKLPKEIKLSQIIQAVERSISLVACVDDPKLCKRAGACVTHDIWIKLKEGMLNVLESITLEKMVEMQRKKWLKQKNIEILLK